MKLNLGSGSCPIEGYANYDAKFGVKIYPLKQRNVDEIRASHVLEHFGHDESIEVLGHWVDCLKPGGVLKIAVPDFDDFIRRYNLGECLPFEMIIMGGQSDKLDYHKSIWTANKLRVIMEGYGLTDVQTWQSEIVDCASYPFSLNLMGVKP